ncbi:MAG TPA: zf-HC2 domain-containing protein [Telluria sp.]
MEHSDVQQLLPAYIDQELSVVDALAVERHLETCLACRREIEAQRSASTRTRAGATYFDAPPALRARILAELPARRTPRASQSMPGSWWRQSWWQQGWWQHMSAALAVALVLALAWGASEYRTVQSPQNGLTEELVANHVRSLQVDHLTDVASTDQHTVKPWFLGKLAFSPPVVDLAPQGFPLVGGRLDYLEGQAVAVLVYRRRHHPINLTIWPGAELPATPQTTQMQGYHLVRWSAGGMNFSAVSDVSADDLAQFVALLKSAT